MNETVLETTTYSSLVGPVRIMFSWYDYVIFSVMLGLSVLIGIYFGCFGTKQSTAKEYLMGNKKMKVFPIAMSLVASHISGITLLGVPADVYRFGAGYWLCIFSFSWMVLATVFIFLPVFFKLQITSTYEYLERRFDERTRVFSSFLFAFSQFFFLPIVIYIPALALTAATGIDLHLIAPVICGICIFYTTIGGLKAVVWTDTLQFTVTLGAVITVLIIGTNATGGFSRVWAKSIEGHRLDIFDLSLDITNRDNFWAYFIGFSFFWTSMSCTNQGSMQKYLSVASLKDAKLTVIYYACGLALVKTASVITGLIIYARYSDCDPFASKQITRSDQLLPYYVLDVAGNIPGLSGLFISGVFSAALSTLSAHLNCLSGTIYEDFVSKFITKEISEMTKSNILKLIVVISGIISTIMVFVVENLGGILPLAITCNSVTAGPLLGMFTLGVVFRKANSNGAFYGGIIGLVALSALAFPAKYLTKLGIIHQPEKPLSTNACNFEFNSTTTFNQTLIDNENEHEFPLVLFKVSFYFYTLIGFAVTLIAGLIISHFTKTDEVLIDEDLLCPLVQRKPTKKHGYVDEEVVEYRSIDKALRLVVQHTGNDNNKTSNVDNIK